MVKADNFHGINVDEVVVPRILSATSMSASSWGRHLRLGRVATLSAGCGGSLTPPQSTSSRMGTEKREE